ncbi:tripartite tricarboxylate transporter permease [Egicoccus sp. AB-alg2]|uniref:tripartite tricarboxylate transporter permease n=1 Tax=Egicoccus sp. AB-alg2 TaxID=3242693 RepID=UPI00359E12FA
MLEGLALISGDIVLYLFLGVAISTFVVIIPGLGGSFALAILLPFIFRLDATAGIAFMMAITAVNGTGNTITSILFGIPGSASGVASTFDGFPMTQRGEGIRAVSAGLTASLIGGLLGAFALALSLPVIRPIVLAFRPPEFFALILLALVFMSYVSGADKFKALISGGLGVMLSFVGMEGSTATQRWTFGNLAFWEGFSLIPVLLGLYAVTEMVGLMRRGGAIAKRPPQEGPFRQLLQGAKDTLSHKMAVLQSSVSGMWVGLAPGMGDAAAQFIGYGQVARTSKRGHLFGTGEVEGVIAADAATNSKEGGALIPTLAFGIPGSSGMAIILAGFLAFGIQPGPTMITDNIDIVWMIIWILVFANIIAAVLCAFITPGMAKVTGLRASLIVGPILVASMLGAFSVRNNFIDVYVLLGFGLLGTLLKEFGYSRPLLLIGFVLGPLLEHNYLLSMRIWGTGFLTRPIVMILGAVMLLVVLSPLIGNLVRGLRRPKSGDDSGDRAEATVAADGE